MNTAKLRPLSGNALKLIAAAAMLIDHVGFMFFPGIRIFRIIGRLAFPIFAFMIAEGCRYTRSRVRYLLTLAGMAVVFQVVYYVVDRDLYMCVFVSFALACSMIFALDYLLRGIFEKPRRAWRIALGAVSIAAAVAFTYWFCRKFTVDYGFYGCLVPVAAYLPARIIKDKEKWYVLPLQLICIAVPLVLLANKSGMSQWYSLFTLPLLLLYSGKRGKVNMKYFFYVFYPAHLVVLWLVDYVVYVL